MYDLDAFLEDERGGDFVLGELVVLCSTFEPPTETSFNTALIYYDSDRDVFQVGNDIDLAGRIVVSGAN